MSATLIELIDLELVALNEDMYPVALDVFATIAQHLPNDEFTKLVDSAKLGLHQSDNPYLINLGYQTILKALEKRALYRSAYEVCNTWVEFLAENIYKGQFVVRSYQTAYKKQHQLEAIVDFIKSLEIGAGDQRELIELAAAKQQTALFAFGHKWQSLCDRIAQVLYSSVLLDSKQETMLVDGKRPDIIVDDGSIRRDPVFYNRISYANLFIDAKLSASVPSEDIQKYMQYCDHLELWVLVETDLAVQPRIVQLDAGVETVAAKDLQSRLVSQGHSELAGEIDDLIEERQDLEKQVLEQFAQEMKRQLRDR